MYPYNIADIFKEAFEDKKSIKSILPKGVSVIGRGIKIQKFDDKTEILNMAKGGMYYKECNEKEYELFYQYGLTVFQVFMKIEIKFKEKF